MRWIDATNGLYVDRQLRSNLHACISKDLNSVNFLSPDWATSSFIFSPFDLQRMNQMHRFCTYRRASSVFLRFAVAAQASTQPRPVRKRPRSHPLPPASASRPRPPPPASGRRPRRAPTTVACDCRASAPKSARRLPPASERSGRRP